MIKAIIHIIIVSLLTLVSQVGGVIWIVTFISFKLYRKQKPFFFRFSTFLLFYLICCITIVPLLAGLFGRVPLAVFEKNGLAPHTLLMPLTNRHYVKPRLKKQLLNITSEFTKKHGQSKVQYLDANFPFIDGFPLLPHRSHDDGRKIDLSFFYTKAGNSVDNKPSRTGYGVFESPRSGEFDQNSECKRSNKFYDYPKYLTLGSSDDLQFDPQRTKSLLQLILKDGQTEKIFIEEHLKRRMRLSNDKLRFQGCGSVRHDDHIHYQIR